MMHNISPIYPKPIIIFEMKRNSMVRKKKTKCKDNVFSNRILSRHVFHMNEFSMKLMKKNFVRSFIKVFKLMN